jgi:hypothetical protein
MSMLRVRLRNTGRFALSLSMLALASSPALAQQTMPPMGQHKMPPMGQQTMPPLEPLPMPDMSNLPKTAAEARTPEEFFAVFDENGDGCIDRSEWRQRIMAIFFALDTVGSSDPAIIGQRGDEELTHTEVPGLSQEAFDAADLDKNGKISGYEFNQAPWAQYEAANPSGVGCLDLAMFTKFLNSLKQQ